MKLYFLIFLLFSLHFSSQTTDEIEKKIKGSPHLISEGKKDEFIQVMNDVIRSSSRIEYPYGIASGYYGKAYIAYINRDFSNSINFSKISERENLGIEYSKLKTENYHLLAENYAELGLNEEAIKYYRKMIISSKTIPDKNKSVYNENIAYNDIASIYQNSKKNSDSSYYYMLKIYNNLHDYNDRDEKLAILLAKATTAIGLLNKVKGKKDSADYYMNQSAKQLPEKFTEISKTPYLFKHLTSLYLSQGQFSKAKKCVDLYTENSKKTKILSDIKSAYELNAEVSEKTDSGKQAYRYLKEYVQLNDSINQIDKNNINTIFNKNLQEKNKRITAEIKYSRDLLIVIILTTLALSVGSYFIKKHLREKNDEKKMSLIKKEFEITALASKINIAFEEVVSLAKNNSPNFLTRFREVYPDFCEKLIEIYPEIQNSELTFCAYLRLGFSTKEIANSIFVTPKTVQMRKYRLRKKLNISSDKDIYIWMNNV
ncbi:tetratricopeptide repeat protein [Chryseobacterium sp. SIMBA_029]|uniref:tetratricopeptide repeat protein n=1 Tax=Chryseobacterium sp. SIMBA_029 TaxID=3085772 RepID=UPI00397D7EB8